MSDVNGTATRARVCALVERGFIKAEVVAFDDFKAIATKKGMSEVGVQILR